MEENQPNDALVQARKAVHLTQKQLAKGLDVSLDSVRNWERGRHAPSPELRSRLTEFFGKSMKELGFLIQETDEEPEDFSSDGLNRRRMLRRVKTMWVDGVLKQSLHQAVLIALGLQDRPDALANPWHLAVQETNVPPSPLPSDTSIVQVYDEAGGELLILGEPGSGKTTLLLKLSSKLLWRAEHQEHLPIPVVLNLESWAVKQSPLGEWLVEELQSKYDVPPSVAEQWIKQKQLTLLLDGLDEVAEGARPACVKAICTYQQEHAISLVICCRREEYFALSTHLTLQRAVVIQPLTKEQIDAYLSRAGKKLKVVSQALQDDPELFEMVQSPLMLSIVALAYQGNQAPLMPTGEPEERRRQIFDTYVQRMLARRGANVRVPAHQTIHWLTELAKQMKGHNQTVFYLEQIQPDWLPDSSSRRRFSASVTRVVFGFTILVGAGLFACFRGDSVPGQPGLFYWLGGGEGNTTLGWMAPGMAKGFEGATSLGIIFVLVATLVPMLGGRKKIPVIDAQTVRHSLVVGLRYGLIIGSITGIFSCLVFGFAKGWAYGLFRGVELGIFGTFTVCLLSGLILLLSEKSRKIREKRFSLGERILNSFFFGTSGFFGFAAIYALQSGGITTLAVSYGLIIGFYHAVAFGLGNGTDLLSPGILIRPAEIVAWSWPIAQIIENGKKGIMLGVGILVAVTPVIVTISSSSYGWQYGLQYGLLYSFMVGTIASIAVILTGILITGWSSDILDDRSQLKQPNEGIRRSVKNAFFAAFLFGPLGGLASGFSCGIIFGLGGVHSWLILAVGFSLVYSVYFSETLWVHFGGVAFIEHYVLRWHLHRKGVIPRNYITFLDYAAERILLRKVGSGYIFIHRLLLEHFANQEIHV